MSSPMLQVRGSEHDFFELNKTLEENVKSLMVELDSIISNQEDVIEKPKNWSDKWASRARGPTRAVEITIIATKCKLPAQIFFFFLFSFLRFFNEWLYFREKYNQISTNKTIIRYLKAQVVKFQADVKALECELKKKNESCKELEIKVKKSEERRESFQNQLSSQKEVIAKAQALSNDLQSKIHTQNTEITSLKKEIEILKRDLKSSNQLTSNCDVRLARSLDENEKLRSSLKTCQTEGKELREQVRKVQEEKRLALKTADKQRTEVFQAFKKQAQLVDNLKKQKAYLEASKEIRFVEEDFVKLLNWKPDNTS
ncbi:LOW QUALITY PROTEIN: golgin subfamily A member 6-like protein 2 [Copidosoma floridanum]|uniref:LOW QUALITY PROTEIN: golgin subfamily A member 6-like protein 2 n=1 Tax=Copidosoma floridanum TaxID=29053 RepID=UPI0006C9A7B9|nr:LOW QUALITY PROTEIN: golgin subfamily A member 6-like protein 2 [Copidosoma floridanum]